MIVSRLTHMFPMRSSFARAERGGPRIPLKEPLDKRSAAVHDGVEVRTAVIDAFRNRAEFGRAVAVFGKPRGRLEVGAV